MVCQSTFFYSNFPIDFLQICDRITHMNTFLLATVTWPEVVMFAISMFFAVIIHSIIFTGRFPWDRR